MLCFHVAQDPTYTPPKAVRERLTHAGFILPDFPAMRRAGGRGTAYGLPSSQDADSGRRRALLSHQAQELASTMSALRVRLQTVQKVYESEARQMFATPAADGCVRVQAVAGGEAAGGAANRQGAPAPAWANNSHSATLCSHSPLLSNTSHTTENGAVSPNFETLLMGALGRSLGLGLGVSLGTDGGDDGADSDDSAGASGRRVRFFHSPTDLLSFDADGSTPGHQVRACVCVRVQRRGA